MTQVTNNNIATRQKIYHVTPDNKENTSQRWGQGEYHYAENKDKSHNFENKGISHKDKSLQK